jgi:hypothetical protein
MNLTLETIALQAPERLQEPRKVEWRRSTAVDAKQLSYERTDQLATVYFDPMPGPRGAFRVRFRVGSEYVAGDKLFTEKSAAMSYADACIALKGELSKQVKDKFKSRKVPP